VIIVLKPDASAEQQRGILDKIEALGLRSHVSQGVERTLIGVIGDDRIVHRDALRALPGVDQVIPVLKPYKIVARESHPHSTVIDIGGVPLGGRTMQVIAGPCSVETPQQMQSAARGVAQAGCRLMRGGAFKPRTSPYSFQGLGVEGLKLLREAADREDLPIVTELMDVNMLDAFLEYRVDVIQIGTRNMQNYDLLREVGRTRTPVVLKRGMAATLEEWLLAGEYIAAGGNHSIIFCERGVRSFEPAYRNMLDVSAIPALKRETHLPVIVDPSHAAGTAWMVPALACAAVAAGADGLLIEMHPQPCEAWSDGDQALDAPQLSALMGQLRAIAGVLDRDV
jgi:3-deoxy-7-phosphoheptulonate synthase